jgi:hypothetical protein
LTALQCALAFALAVTSLTSDPTTSLKIVYLPPVIAHFNIRSLDGGPGDAARRFFLARVSGMGVEGVVESLAIDILRVRRQMVCDRRRQILVGTIGHREPPFELPTEIEAT